MEDFFKNPLFNRTGEDSQAVSNHSTTTTQSASPGVPEDDGVSTGGAVGIVLGVLAIVILVVVLVILHRRGLLPGRSRKPDTVIFSFDTSFQNLIDNSNARRPESDSQSYASSSVSCPSNISSAEGNQNYAPSGYTSTDFSYIPRRSTHAPSSSRHPPNRPSHTLSTYAPSGYPPRRSTYTQGVPKYTHDSFRYIPSNPQYTQRSYAAPSFNYRPSRHIDRQLMAYYNWSINEEFAEPARDLGDSYRVLHVPGRRY